MHDNEVEADVLFESFELLMSGSMAALTYSNLVVSFSVSLFQSGLLDLFLFFMWNLIL